MEGLLGGGRGQGKEEMERASEEGRKGASEGARERGSERGRKKGSERGSEERGGFVIARNAKRFCSKFRGIALINSATLPEATWFQVRYSILHPEPPDQVV
jgi:hypothetical protein